jgi:hypothetical protein
MAVIGATQLEPVNVLGSYIQGAQLGQQMRAQRRQEAEALRTAQQEQALNALVRSGALTTPEGRNQLMQTPGGLALLESYGKTQEQLGKGTEAQTKGLASRMQFFRQNIPFNPQGAAAWLRSAYADPEVGAELSKMGTLEEAIAAIPQDPAAYLQWMEGVSMFADEYAKRRVPTAEALLPYDQPLSPEVFEQQRALRGAGASRTTIQLPGRKRGEELEKLGAADLAAEYNAVKSAARGLKKDYETLRLLREGKPSTGITSEIEVGLNRIKADIGGDREAAERVSDSQYLEALLGSDVFQQMSALGVGARGLDTPAEREFLREVVSGTRKLDKDTLIRMAEMRAKYKEDLVQDYNSRIESGELDDFFENYGRPKRPFKIPERPQAPSEPATFATEAEAEAAFKAGRIKKGDRIIIGGVSGRWE